ncbi:MAG: DUF4037 domain-containing protein, partial [Anaerolineae bacterium]|nr:DUF4037 domain-containing protein [Anaerolineae bacterium]
MYHTEPITRAQREALAIEYAGADHPSIELDKPYWGSEDAWVDAASGLGVDLIYWSPDWIEAQIERVIVQHHAQAGYSTAFWYTILRSTPLFDRAGWFAALQARAQQPYPDPLRKNVLCINYPLLRQSGSSYHHQIELAILRQDRVSVNHRVAALLASYFDIIFAVNRQPQPGEKRLIALAAQCCTTLPE